MKNLDLQKACQTLREQAELVPPDLREWWLTYLDAHYTHYESVLSLLPICEGMRLLELGAVPGHLTYLLKQTKVLLESVDLQPGRLGQFWEHIDVHVKQSDIEQTPLPFPDGSFDIVLFTEILEHLRINPLFALKEVNRVLRWGGSILLSTPNITPVQRLMFLMGKDYQGDPVTEFGRLETIGHMGHIRIYSFSEVQRFIEYAGFRVSRYYRRGRRLHAGKGRMFARLYPVKSHLCSHLYMLAEKC